MEAERSAVELCNASVELHSRIFRAVEMVFIAKILLIPTATALNFATIPNQDILDNGPCITQGGVFSMRAVITVIRVTAT